MTSGKEWQESIALRINELRAAPEVAAMTGAERAGFLWLLLEQWNGSDGYLPADEEFLKAASGLREEWAGASRRIMRMFSVGKGGLCHVPTRERWERAAVAHQAMSDGGRRGAAARVAQQVEASRPEAGRKVASRRAAEPVRPVNTLKTVCVELEDKSKGIVIRGYEPKNSQAEETTELLAEKPQLIGQENESSDLEKKLAPSTKSGENGPQNAVENTPLSCTDGEAGGVSEIAPQSLSPASARMVLEQINDGLKPQVDTGKWPGSWSGFAEWTAAQNTPAGDSEPKDETQGAGMPADAHGERVGAASEPNEDVFSSSEPEMDESAEIDAMRAAASFAPVRRRPVGPARTGGGRW